MNQSTKERLVRVAQEEAEHAIREGNPPFGAVLADGDGQILFRAHNTQNSDCDPTAHAEINLLRRSAPALGSRRLAGYVLGTNAEPCPMCMSAAIKAGISRIIFGVSQESGSSPSLSAAEIASRARYSVEIDGGHLVAECAAQVLKGRRSLTVVATHAMHATEADTLSASNRST